MKQEGKTAQQDFSSEELLFRRFPPHVIVEGEVLASSIRFDEPPSFCRERFAKPEDTIHPNCANSQDVSMFGVFGLSVLSIMLELPDKQGSLYIFQPAHKPLPDCYAHSQVHCTKQQSRLSDSEPADHIQPPKEVRKAFRGKLATQLSVLINPMKSS